MMKKLLFLFNSLPLSRKVPAVIMLSGFGIALLVGSFGFLDTRAGLEQQAFDKLSALVEARERAVANWLQNIEADLLTQAQNPAVHDAALFFTRGWEDLEASGRLPTMHLQNTYIVNNPYPIGEKQLYVDAGTDDFYNSAHVVYHEFFRTLQQSRGYYDIFLFDTEGNLIYSVFKEMDYATNFVTGSLADTGLGEVFGAVRDNPQSGYMVLTDYQRYAPSNGAPASFTGTPLIDAEGNFLGVLAFQMPVEALNAIMTEARGLGETGQTYLVGRDGLMRSQSRLSNEDTILSTQVDTPQIAQALSGERGVSDAWQNYRGEQVIAAYAPLNFGPFDWAVIAEQNRGEALRAIDQAFQGFVWNMITGLSILLVVGYGFSRNIALPITAIAGATRRLMDGHLQAGIPGIKRRDEIGVMAQALLTFRKNMAENEKLRSEHQKLQQKTDTERHKLLQDLADEFEKSSAGVVQKLVSSSREMHRDASHLLDVSQKTSHLSSEVASSSQDMSNNVETIAGAAEKLTSSVAGVENEINVSVKEAQNATNHAQDTQKTVEGLGKTVQEISLILEIIQEIAEKTNLLALNATIEAARAGESGKGFAVVAHEVKNLANQTGKATQDIAQQIERIQSVSTASVTAITNISRIITGIDERINSVASEMNQQSSTIQEIARNVQQAATGTRSVSRNIAEVSTASDNTREMVQSVLDSSSGLQEQSNHLQDYIQEFVQKIRHHK